MLDWINPGEAYCWETAVGFTWIDPGEAYCWETAAFSVCGSIKKPSSLSFIAAIVWLQVVLRH
jgi:hypothetical protein